ncbi:MAG: GNAT family N-acetyltransferase [Kiritimatiellae bacterium]|nr:GNAT family N-acetyltransferase [Kiritimatiellia bacterium]
MHELPRVKLVPISVAHTDLVLQWRADPVIARELFSEKPPTREEHLAWLATLGTNRREFVIEATEDQRPLGTIGLSRIDLYNANAEYGILLGKEARGRGFGFAASELLLKHAFDELLLHRLYLRVFANNEPAIKLYERLGFQREGLLREQGRSDLGFRDVIFMGLLKREWHTRASRS